MTFKVTNKAIKETVFLKDGRVLTIEAEFLARRADGSVVVRMGNTILLATVAIGDKIEEHKENYFPLKVSYREKYYAGGKIPSGFVKREGRPSNEEILTMRLVDRVLRPLLPKNFSKAIQVMITLLSYGEGEVLPDSLAGLAASAALIISGVPFNGPISEVRIIKNNGKFILNPIIEHIEKLDMDLVIGASKDAIVMIDGEMKEIYEEHFLQALKEAHEYVKIQIEAQHRLLQKIKPKKKYYSYYINNKNFFEEKIKNRLYEFSYEEIRNISKSFLGKKKRSRKYEKVLKAFKKLLTEELYERKEICIKKYFNDIKRQVVRFLILKNYIRIDGRTLKQIRPIWSLVNYLPNVHGSALFTRGDTQSLVTVTLGSSIDVNRIDSAVLENREKFYLHYNFPPFSTGDIRQILGVSRREIGHGILAQRALNSIIPNENPYTIRLVSDTLESDGSSSMASVCSGTLALMDAGISIKKPVAGISMGFVYDEITNEGVIISDLLSEEDYFGDMDFKIAGTKFGVTACQMDIKNRGVPYNILEKVLFQAREGRLQIFQKIIETLPVSRKNLKDSAPKIIYLDIPKDFIGSVIGSGGKVIQEIQEYTDTSISIEEKGGVGLVEVFGKNFNKIHKAIDIIKSITFFPKIGGIYKAKVKSIKDFGAFVELAKGVEGLLHISEIDNKRLNKVENVLKIGDEIKVKLIGIDGKKIKLSRKVLLPQSIKESYVE
ncbi:MAG TPA: polyribonucleotide nucleotidyltransferase [Blattabacteriaceae bacterium]